MKYKLLSFILVFSILHLVINGKLVVANDITLVPSIELKTEYDDNIDFDETDEQDDFSGTVSPKFLINYSDELFKLNSIAQVDIQRYLNQTDYDNEKYRFGIDGEYQATSRLKFLSKFDFKRDETIDTQLEETGRAFEREDRDQFDASGGFRYQITELTDMGPNLFFRDVSYSDDSVDYQLYSVSLPVRKQFKNELDEIIVEPAFTRYNSDNEEADDIRLTIEWNRLISETLKLKIKAGPRYTITDEKDTNNDSSRWGGIGEVGLTKTGELFSAEMRASHDLRSSSDGTIIQVSRVFIRFNKAIFERFGVRLYGNAVYSKDEGDNDIEDRDKVFFYEIQPSLYYEITENHTIGLFYSYQEEKEFDEPGNPVTNRNRAWISLNLAFPYKL